ncbi:MAG TPA: hypothetical protein VGI83_05185 [Gemmatimonadales bacterium]
MTGAAIVSPGYPAIPGGVTDHTARLVRHWSVSGPVPVFSERAGDAPAIVERWHRDGLRAVLLQYVPFLYGRRGLSRFPEQVAVAARARGLRCTVFVHEPWVPPTRLPWLVLSPLQRRQLFRLLARADGCVTAVPAWRTLLRDLPQLMYVGSTLGPPPAPAAPPLGAPVVFSPLAAGLNWDWILGAVRAIGTTPPLIVIGESRERMAADRGVGHHADPAWDWRGRLPAPEALGLLGRAPLVLAPFTDGITGRRTSALAALSTGARVITSTGPLYDPAFQGGPQAATSAEAFATLAQGAWQTPDDAASRAARRAWHDARFDAQTLDANLLRIVMGP